MVDALSFSPYHGLSTHRPLGAIKRVWHAACAESATARVRRQRRRQV